MEVEYNKIEENKIEGNIIIIIIIIKKQKYVITYFFIFFIGTPDIIMDTSILAMYFNSSDDINENLMDSIISNWSPPASMNMENWSSSSSNLVNSSIGSNLVNSSIGSNLVNSSNFGSNQANSSNFGSNQANSSNFGSNQANSSNFDSNLVDSSNFGSNLDNIFSLSDLESELLVSYIK